MGNNGRVAHGEGNMREKGESYRQPLMQSGVGACHTERLQGTGTGKCTEPLKV